MKKAIITSRYGKLAVPTGKDLVVNSLHHYGEWAQKEIDILENFIKIGNIVIDAGAFVGTHALAFSKIVGPNGKVHAFEPNSAIYPFLDENSAKTQFSNIKTYPFALGKNDEKGVIVNSWEGVNEGASRLVRCEGRNDKQTVSVKPLDAINIGPVDFIKADVEGMELDVLAGADLTIHTYNPIIFIEVNSLEASSGIITWANHLKYNIYGLISPAFNPHNFNNVKDNIFNQAKECGLLLIHAEKTRTHIATLNRFNLPKIQTVDDIVLLLLHKPQYPIEILKNTSVGLKCGIDYSSPASNNLERKIDDQINNFNQAIEARDKIIRTLNQTISERDHQIRSLNQTISDRDKQIGELNQAIEDNQKQKALLNLVIEERDALIGDFKREVEERDNYIHTITTSKSWFLTKPLRFLARLFRGEFAVAFTPIRNILKKRQDSKPAINNEANNDLAWQRDVVRELFDESFYLQAYPEVAALSVDPLDHYLTNGWQENRNPSRHFNTEFYLQVNQDVLNAGINPLVHFAIAGKQEGRLVQHPGGYRAAILQTLEEVDDTIRRWKRTEVEFIDPIDNLENLLQKKLSKSVSAYVIISFSHDSYKTSIGGIQLCIEEEQYVFSNAGHIYLHISPYQPLPVLAETPTEKTVSQVILDGVECGCYKTIELYELLIQLLADRETRFIIHALHGQCTEWIITLYDALKPYEVFYWVHDYFSVCPGYTLLRNGVNYCNAPKLNSSGCQLCIFVKYRTDHLAHMNRLFCKIPFTVVSPSEYALKLWKKTAELPYHRSIVHEHRTLNPTKQSVRIRHDEAPLRIAFLGHPASHKGWFAFQDLVMRFGNDHRYRFFHLGSSTDTSLSVEFIQVIYSAGTPDAMEQTLRSKEIDVALILSTWPETFCLTAYEAIASGAMIITYAVSGNVAMVADQDKLGIVVNNDVELFNLFQSDQLIKEVSKFQRGNRTSFRLSSSGITASLVINSEFCRNKPSYPIQKQKNLSAQKILCSSAEKHRKIKDLVRVTSNKYNSTAKINEKIACFTSFTFSYIDKARLLMWSLKRFHPEWHLIALITDSTPEQVHFSKANEPFDEIIWGQELPIDNIQSWLFMHDIVEICTAVKGVALKQIAVSGYDKVIYLDPDIVVFNSLQPIIDLLDKNNVVLTPHQIVPESDDSAIIDNEICSLKHGIYNLGFLAISCKDEGMKFADWWSDRLIKYCYDDISNGLFTDQRWCDHVPVFFDGVHVLKDPGYNVASWNLSNRNVTIDDQGNLKVNGVPLRFYHITKFGPLGETMTLRYAGDNTVIYEIWAWYRRKLRKFEMKGLPADWWYYGRFENGEKITREMRLLYRQRKDLQRSFPNPFQCNQKSYFEWFTKTNRLSE